jgi:two-component system, chemotaxis family, CheB/CheR fusion protein
VDESQEEGLERLLSFLKRSRGFDFSAYKKPSLERRIQKRMAQQKVATYDDYVDYLEVHQDEFHQLFNTILINVTGFFRDEDAWQYLKDEIVPKIVEAKGPEEQIRIWSAGVASGEEAYTIAMILAEHLGKRSFCERVKVFGTDADDEALNQARAGAYEAKAIQKVPEELKKKYLESVGDRMAFDREMRRAIIFGKHDLLQDAPISRVDLLLCRNTLMYFNAQAQEQVIAKFHFALADDGYLFLGKAETMLTHAALFAPEDLKRRVFSKISVKNGRDKVGIVINGNDKLRAKQDGQVKLRDAVLDHLPFPQIVLDASGNLLSANENARSYFGILDDDLDRPLKDLQISYRPIELRSLIERAAETRKPVDHKDIPWTPAFGGESLVLDMQIQPLSDGAETLLGFSILWRDVSHFKRLQDELVNFNQELETAYEELQSTNEELQTTNEELQSTVEELETTNEELQSTNEELETMNEELQSGNEELGTMNEELLLRSDDLNAANLFLHAVLAGFQESVFVLDNDLKVLAWNPTAQEQWGLKTEELAGNHFLNLAAGLPGDQLLPMIRECQQKISQKSVASIKATNRRGKPVNCAARVMPLPDQAGEQRGVIVVIGEGTEA